jgi:hypothetical protein
MEEYFASLYKGLILTSAFAFLIGASTTGATSLHSYQAGYFVLGFGILLIFLSLIKNMIINKTFSLFTLLPFGLLLGIITCLLYLTFAHKKIIIDSRVANGYFTFSNTAVILLVIQLFIIYYNVQKDTFKKEGITKDISGIILLLATLTAISTNIVRVILKFFTTDGFENNTVLQI